MEFGSAEVVERSLSELARTARGSEILRIAAEIREGKAAGREICNLSIGDFAPSQFPIPEELRHGIERALDRGHTNYPPPDGVVGLRQAVARFYARELTVDYPAEAVVIASGARPLLYALFRCLLDPGDVVVYAVPSWNNNHYVELTGARAVELSVGPESNFFPLPEQLDEYLPRATLVALNSPLNPTGTVIAPEILAAICERVVSENRRRERAGQKGLWLSFDQVYWQLVFGENRHAVPSALVPEVAPYTILVDAASKSYAATGLRVGWAVMPPALSQRVANLIGHMGAWAPHAEQVAMAQFLEDEAAQRRYRDGMLANVRRRLDLLADGFISMRADRYPVEVIAPQGAIYLSVRIIESDSNESIRKRLLEEAGVAVVPFQAFGQRGDTGWFRLSVGAVSVEDIQAAFPRLRKVLRRPRD